ncbi:hypothetical protein P7K49_035501, partial [Saguinus oedipus]
LAEVLEPHIPERTGHLEHMSADPLCTPGMCLWLQSGSDGKQSKEADNPGASMYSLVVSPPAQEGPALSEDMSPAKCHVTSKPGQPLQASNPGPDLCSPPACVASCASPALLPPPGGATVEG